MDNFWVLAFDIERSGGTAAYDTIAIGACVLDTRYRPLEHYLGAAYDPKQTKFEKRCYDEFWAKHPGILEKLGETTAVQNPDNSYIQKQKNMIAGFVEFVKKWENLAREQNIKLYRVCDNTAFDVHFINQMIYKFVSRKMLPFPYEFSTQKYGTLWETHSVMKGLLMAQHPEGARADWGFSKSLRKLYPKLPRCKVQSDHMPHHDAQVIAHEFVWLMGISSGRYHQKSSVTDAK